MKPKVALLAFVLILASWSGAGAQTRPAAPPPPKPFHIAINASTLAGLQRPR